MGTDRTWTEYRCAQDCKMCGCPGHHGELAHNRTVDGYSFNMDGREMYFEHGELEAMIQLLKQLELFGLKEGI